MLCALHFACRHVQLISLALLPWNYSRLRNSSGDKKCQTCHMSQDSVEKVCTVTHAKVLQHYILRLDLLRQQHQIVLLIGESSKVISPQCNTMLISDKNRNENRPGLKTIYKMNTHDGFHRTKTSQYPNGDDAVSLPRLFKTELNNVLLHPTTKQLAKVAHPNSIPRGHEHSHSSVKYCSPLSV